jgi:hypothetical protein
MASRHTLRELLDELEEFAGYHRARQSEASRFDRQSPTAV